jgi:hypothetical protein
MKFVLTPLQETTIPARGETVVYLSGSEPLLITANGRRAEIPPASQNTFPTFDTVTFQNMGEVSAEFEILIVDGIYQSHTSGSTVRAMIDNPTVISGPIVKALAQQLTANIANTVDIREITETLKTEMQNPSDISSPIVAKIADLIGSVINIRAITETLKTHVLNTVDIRTITETLNIRQITETIETNVLNTVTAQITGIVNTLEKPATNIVTSNKTYTAGESFTIPANTNRRDITIFAAETNTDTVTVAGIPLASGQYVELKNYVGSIGTTAAAASKITILEVIK